MPRGSEIVGLNPTGCWSFFFSPLLSYQYSEVFPHRDPRGAAALLISLFKNK